MQKSECKIECREAPFVPPEKFVIHETDHWWVNHRCDTPYPGYLMVGAKNPNGTLLSDLCSEALAELGALLARCGELLEERLGAVRVYDGRYGHQPGHTVHYHVIPVYDWTISMYWQDERYRTLTQFYDEPNATPPNDFDGADMTLFIWRTFAEPGVTPPKIFCTSVDDVVRQLREAFDSRGGG